MQVSQKYTLASGIEVTLQAWHTTYWPSDRRKKPVQFTSHMSTSLALENIKLYSGAGFHDTETREENLEKLAHVLALLKASPNDIADIKAGVYSLARELNIQID